MSTIFADKFKNTSGGNNVKINQLSGIDTAGSITVQGEGTATTNLQQGLCKAWFRADGGAGTVVIGDSLNKSSIVDNGTGQYTLTYTNNMGSTNYTQAWDQKIDVGTNAETNLCGLHASSGAVSTKTTSQYKVNSQDLTSAQEDHSQVGSIVMGDLA
tara:strand:- start:1471 stop:1941 length:471 start_codon:yes stop_codon:yes gene_type:complete